MRARFKHVLMLCLDDCVSCLLYYIKDLVNFLYILSKINIKTFLKTENESYLVTMGHSFTELLVLCDSNI